MKKAHLFFFGLILAAFIASCGSNTTNENPYQEPTPPPPANPSASGGDKGVGKFTNVELTHPLDEKMVTAGKSIYEVKCGSCHKLSDEKLVGPGWKGVTDRRKPEWIMNFATNTDEMLDKDAEAKAMMEVCMVRMPNQHLSDDEARQVLEFMRKNDNKN
jgi:mono/diheme cytochrome c family protein